MDAVCKAAFQSGVGVVDEFVHFLLVTGEYGHELAGVVRHAGHQCLDGLVARLVLHARRIGRHEGIRLVDKQHSAHRLVYGLLHILAGGVDIAVENMLALLAHHMTLGQNAQSLEHLAHPLCHFGLARARISGDDYMDVGLLHLAAAHGLDAC